MRGVVETACEHGGAAGWSVALGSALTFAVLEKRLRLPASVSLLGMGAETPPLSLTQVFLSRAQDILGLMRPRNGDLVTESGAGI